MITIGYLIIAAAAFTCLIWCLRAYMEQKTTVLLLTLIPLLFLWFDSFAVATGRFIGEGPIMLGVTYLRYAWHWGTLPLLIIVAGILLRRAGFLFAQNKIVMGLFCALAVFFIVYDFRYIFIVDFYPACFAETLRYVTKVSETQACSPDMAGVGMSVSPAAAILTNLILMAVGIAIWVRHKWPWLAIGCMIMFAAAAVPQSLVGPIVGNMGEPIFNFAVVAAAIRYGGRKQQDSREQESIAA